MEKLKEYNCDIGIEHCCDCKINEIAEDALEMVKKKGKDGRSLSDYQQKPWMDKIGRNRKYKNQARGEASGVAKLKEKNVRTIREVGPHMRKEACAIYGISERHWYSIRARQKWNHI